MKIIVGTQGRINQLLAGIPEEDFMGLSVLNDKAWVILKGDAELELDNLTPTDVLVDCSKYLTEIDNLKAECKTKTAKIKELQDELANCLNAEADAKKECNEAKKQLDVYIKENVKLGKDLEKRDDAIGKLKEDLAKVKSALKALE